MVPFCHNYFYCTSLLGLCQYTGRKHIPKQHPSRPTSRSGRKTGLLDFYISNECDIMCKERACGVRADTG
ncbi:hypothetical protein HMPREF1548_00372 [Clostridium sp. KLE 1755]|nr:hypothetical protein HMPREF1548_00372 [Clostridium sp. KLE 1755]